MRGESHQKRDAQRESVGEGRVLAAVEHNRVDEACGQEDASDGADCAHGISCKGRQGSPGVPMMWRVLQAASGFTQGDSLECVAQYENTLLTLAEAPHLPCTCLLLHLSMSVFACHAARTVCCA